MKAQARFHNDIKSGKAADSSVGVGNVETEGDHHHGHDNGIDQRPFAKSIKDLKQALTLENREPGSGCDPSKDHAHDLEIGPCARENGNEEGEGIDMSLPHITDSIRQGKVKKVREARDVSFNIGDNVDCGAKGGVG